VRVLVLGRGVPHQVPAAVLLGGHHIRGRRHDDRVRAVHVLPVADRVADTVRGQHRQLRVAVPCAGDAHVAPDSRPVPRSRRGRGVAGHGTGRGYRARGAAGHRAGGQRRRSPVRRGRTRGHGQTDHGRVLDAVRRPVRLEAGADHHAVLRLPAGQRVLRAAVLLGGRAARLPRPDGRHHRHRVSVAVPRHRQRGLLYAAPRPPEDAGRRVRRRHGRVAGHRHRLHAHVQGRGHAPVRRSAHRSVRRVRVLRLVGHAPVAVDHLRRGVPDGRQRCRIKLLL